MNRPRITSFAALAAVLALAVPATASAGITDAEFLQLLKQAQPDMQVTTETQQHGELPAPTTHGDPAPVVTPAPSEPATPAPVQPLQPAPAPVTPAPAPSKAKPDGTRCRKSGRVRRCETVRGGKLASVCVTSRRTRTCTHYRDGRPARRCVRVGGRNRCRTLARAVGHASTMTWEGWPSKTVNAVGKIVTVDAAGKSWLCSGTVVSKTLMLTAAHCLYENGYRKKVYFAPGQSAAADGSPILPLNTWEATNWWVTDGYRNSQDWSQDFGLVEIPPVNGRYLGDVTGSYSITPGMQWSTGKRAYLMGYPSSGFWGTAAGYFGNGQYACDVNWNEGYSVSGSGYDLWASCPMTPGSSGGPWFALNANNQWTVVGVTSRCSGPVDSSGKACMPRSNYLITSYMDTRFFTFWNAVNSQRRY